MLRSRNRRLPGDIDWPHIRHRLLDIHGHQTASINRGPDHELNAGILITDVLNAVAAVGHGRTIVNGDSGRPT